jgi:hypothetical protein
LTEQCSATKRNGERCTLPANGPQGLCWAHDPKNAEKRRRGASRGGRGKGRRDLASVKAQLQEMADKVLLGEQDRSAAAVAGQLLNIKLRAIEVERKVKETDELEERIEALERTSGAGGGKRWGA